MEVSLNMFKTILKTVPISYYTGRNIDTEISTTADTSYYEPLIDKITISYKGMESMFEKMKSSDDLEECIRSVLYHEISHALITPKNLMNTRDETDAYLFNVFEDERIETVFKDYYYGVNFKKNIVLMNNYEGQKPTNAFEAFYYTVRFRSGKREHLNIVDNIIEKYYDMDNEERGSYTVSYYQNDIKDLFNKICKDWYENNDKKTLDEFDPKYDSKSQSGKEQSAGDCARKQNKESGGTMGDDTITTIILVDDDFDENGHNHNPKKEGKGGGNTVIMKPGSGEPGKGDGNMPSPTSNKEGDDKENKKNLTDEQVLEAAEGQEKLHIAKSKSGIVVKGIHDVAVRFSKCCNPIPGDEIVGFVTRGRGITIHRTDCVNVLNMSEIDRTRLIEAEWQQPDVKAVEKYMAGIQVYANNRTGLLVDLSKIFTERKIDLRSINSRTNKQEKATISMSFEISSKEELRSLIEKIRQVESVIDVERTTG